LYAQALGEQLDGLSFALINNKEMGFKGLGQSEAAPGIRTDIEKASGEPEWLALQQQWSDMLERLADEFITGAALVTPRDPKRSCTYCKLESLCRVR